MSKPIPFAPDVQYMLMGVGYEVIRVTADGNLLVKNLMTPQTQEQVHSMAVLRQYWHEGKLMFIIPEGANLRNSRESPFKLTYEFSDLSDIPLSLREETWNRYVLIKPLLALPKLERTKAAINNRIQEFFQERREQEGQSSIILGRHIGKGVGPRKKKMRAPRSLEKKSLRMGNKIKKMMVLFSESLKRRIALLRLLPVQSSDGSNAFGKVVMIFAALFHRITAMDHKNGI